MRSMTCGGSMAVNASGIGSAAPERAAHTRPAIKQYPKTNDFTTLAFPKTKQNPCARQRDSLRAQAARALNAQLR